MHKEILQKVISYLVQRRKDCRCTGKKVVSILACVVVFCTAYVLIRPASTLEETLQETPQCGKIEHTHSEVCYTKTDTESGNALVCTLESLDLHEHTEAYLDENGNYCCGYSDFVVHEHNEDCFDGEGKLLCTLPEVKAHTHDASCYTQPEAETEQEQTETEQEQLESDPTQETSEPGQEASDPTQETSEPGQEASDPTQETSEPGQEASDPTQEISEPGQEPGEVIQEITEPGQETGEVVQEITEPGQETGEVVQEITEPGQEPGEVVQEITDPAQETTELIQETAEPIQEMTESVQGTAETELICGKPEIILHEHTPDCFDENDNLICGKTQVLEHVHTEACFQTGEENADAETLTCDLEEHTHSAACSVIGLIEALPTRQSVEERMAAFEENEDEEGSDAYLAELKTQLQEAYDAYAALSEEEQAKVTNRNRLTELEWLQDDSQQETADVTVTNDDNTEADVVPWESDATEVQKKLQDELHSINLGYTIQQVEYYQIDNLKEGTATVTYNSGSGLNAAEDEKVFVYDLGMDEAEAMTQCTVGENLRKENDTITEFSFTPEQESISEESISEDSISEDSISEDNESHVYAFLSASPVTLEDMGIYLGKKQNDGTWIAMDGPNADSSNVKVTITLTDDSAVSDNYCPFIRKVEEGDYYPKDEAVRSAVGEFEAMQCYEIQWVLVNGDGTYDLNMPREYGMNAIIQLEYLNPQAQLKGEAGGRNLRIFSSQNTGGTSLEEISETVEDVKVQENNYKGFTFKATELSPYVFVSEKVEKGYIEALSIKEIIDGSAPFDDTDEPGYDSNESNKIVRSYDTIKYTLGATFAARQDAVTQEEVKMYFEMTLNKSATVARFDISKTGWLGENYSIEYLDGSGNVIMVMAHDGKYYSPIKNPGGSVLRDEQGFVYADKNKPVYMNAKVSGSINKENSYKELSGGVVAQRLVGWTTIHAKDGENVLSGTQGFETGVEVRNADNNETFAPKFRMWLEGNEDNYGPETIDDNGVLISAQPDTDNILDLSEDKNRGYQVTVSAGTNFNVQLKKNSDMSYKNWFNFSTGQLVEEPTRSELVQLAQLLENRGKSNPADFTENREGLPEDKKKQYANYRYGRMTCYGITLQLYNDTQIEVNRASKGLRGLSLPVGDISFDLNFSSEVKSSAGEPINEDQYTAILWDYNENVPANTSYFYAYQDPGRGKVTTPSNGLGNGGRNLYWDGETRSPYAKGGAPSWFRKYHDGCYYGGDWALVDENGQKVDDIGTIATPTIVEGTGAGTTYHFSVSDYDFDFDDQHFPTRDAGNSGNVEGYDTYARCFSAGCVQVLSVFPMVQRVSEAEVFLNSTVSNLYLKTRAGQVLKAKDDDTTKINHEVNKDDNKKRDQIVLYAPGGLTKGSSFNGKHNGQPPETTTEGFLGTEYWTTSYDCSTFAGDDIWIVSYGMISSGSDYRMRSMNLLQLFDSRALSIRNGENPQLCQNYDNNYDEPGKATFLYAADPGYPEGYDSNKDGVLNHMNSVREEDLRYFSSLDDLKKEGYTCVGVLMELRGCDLLGGKYQYMRIPVKVNGDDTDLVRKTVATVNTFRVWSYDLKDDKGNAITWEDGVWNDSNKKNELKGFSKPNNKIEGDQYSGELANQPKSSPPYYVKTEYQGGHQVTDTHAGGTQSGNSLLILSYEAGINIGVDNKTSDSMISYNIGDGETVVDYRLKSIRTKISDLTGQTQNPKTTLTVQAILDEGHTGTQRISVSGGSYQIMGNHISEDPNNPTELEFEDSDGKRYCIKVHAQLGAGNQSVNFVIQDAPVGIYLPDITFQANFAAANVLKNSDTIKTSAYISGEGDNRAYAKAKGNTDNITVGVILRSGTNLTKTVDMRYIELNGEITYHVMYTNSGTEKINKIYFYDLLPHNEDSRGSKFSGRIIPKNVDVTFSQVENGNLANATVYYSTVDSSEFYDEVKAFGGSMSDNGKISGMDANKIEEMLSESEMFNILGRIEEGEFQYNGNYSLNSNITGLYMTVNNLQKGQTVDMQITVKTEGNKANDWYKNIANNWIADSATLPLISNKVETQVVSRSISGVVWYDKNLNGIRDEGELLLEGVTATLFKKGEDGTYGICKTDVTGGTISPVTTDANGTYSFDKLAAGDYIVAFSGANALEKYTGTTSYQVNGKNDANTSDGKVIKNNNEYKYYIRYSNNSNEMKLHSIEEMGTVTLNNGTELYSNQDLGLIDDTFELPQTGGTGTTLYIIVGLLLTTMSAMFFWYTRKRNRTEDSVSSW